jgi:hypothetical protein
MPLRTWRRIVAGEDEVCGFKTAFEEFQGWVHLRFNGDGYGSLYATYGDDGGQIYIGDLNDAAIVIDEEEIPWAELKRPGSPTANSISVAECVTRLRHTRARRKCSGRPTRSRISVLP